MRFIHSSLSDFPGDPDILGKIADFANLEKAEEKNAILAQADAFAVVGQAVKAMNALIEGLVLFPNDSFLKDKLHEYKDTLGDAAAIAGYKKTDAVEVYMENWNSAVPFKLDGNVVEPGNLYGLRLLDGSYFNVYDGYSNFGYSSFSGIVFNTNNTDLVYSKIIVKSAHDDLSDKQSNTNKNMNSQIYAYSKSLGFKTLTSYAYKKDDSIISCEADITGYEEINIRFSEYNSGESVRYSYSVGNVAKYDVYQDYILFFVPKLYK
jgi:hypothetical protein